MKGLLTIIAFAVAIWAAVFWIAYPIYLLTRKRHHVRR